jgi:PAS domain S-box-containing protein
METWIHHPKSKASLCTKSLESLFKNSPTAMLVKGSDGRVKDANASACKLLRVKKEEIISQQATEWFQQDFDEGSLRDGEPRLATLTQQCGSVVTASIHSTPIQSGSTSASLISIWPEEHPTRDDNTVINQQAASRHIANVITDSLTPIQGFVSLAQEDIRDGHIRRAHLDQIAHAADRGAQFARDLFAYSAHSPRRSTSYVAGELLEDLQQELTEIAGDAAVISYNIASNAPSIKVHKEDFQTIIRHAIGNAAAGLDHNTQSGILIEVHCAAGTDSKESNSTPAPDGSTVITITDHAPALSEKVCARVFDPFYSLPQRQDPHGLRLPTVSQLMRNHYGSAGFYSTPGKGNTLELIFAQSRH